MEKLPSPEWNALLGAAANARRGLPPLVGAYFRAGREFLAGRPTPAELHELRLATKRLRYTLELFRRCYGPAFDPYMADLHDLQQALGELNDCVASRNLLARAMPPSPLRDKLERFLGDKEARRARRVREIWTGQFDAAGREAAWVRYLGRQARGKAGSLRKRE
ncbi:MAG: CHAD domain-containing protein [Bryobacteraceae bacterium]